MNKVLSVVLISLGAAGGLILSNADQSEDQVTNLTSRTFKSYNWCERCCDVGSSYDSPCCLCGAVDSLKNWSFRGISIGWDTCDWMYQEESGKLLVNHSRFYKLPERFTIDGGDRVYTPADVKQTGKVEFK